MFRTAAVVASVALAASACAAPPEAGTTVPASSQQATVSEAPSTASVDPSQASPSPSSTPSGSATPEPVPSEQPAPASTPPPSVKEWAATVVATSEFSARDFAAQQVVGPSQATKCGRDPRAWASATARSKDTVTVTFAKPVIPTEVEVYILSEGQALMSVDLFSPDGDYANFPAYSETQFSEGGCALPLRVPVTGVMPVAAVRLNVDQSSSKRRILIDAVRIVGAPAQ